MTRTLMTDAFSHHVWATLELIDACLPLSADQLATAVPGTYGSILDTMRHLVGADAQYLNLLTDGRVARIDEASMDLARLRAEMEAHGPAWSSLIGPDLDPDRVVTGRWPDGSGTSAPVGIRLAQAVHHGTDHRSQICTALTALGIEPPGIDAWDFALHDGRLVELPATS